MTRLTLIVVAAAVLSLFVSGYALRSSLVEEQERSEAVAELAVELCETADEQRATLATVLTSVESILRESESARADLYIQAFERIKKERLTPLDCPSSSDVTNE